MSIHELPTLARVLLATTSLAGAGLAQLRVDFNSTTQDGGPHPHAAFQSYDAGHEVPGDFVTQSFTADFGSGPVTITVTPEWPTTASASVMQMIDRGQAYDGNWVGDDIDLLTDWIGADSRLSQGGNGDWDRTTPSATYLTLTLGGLPAGNYQWISYHHDTENVWADFQVEVSVDGGMSFGAPIDKEMTSSSPGGNPADPNKETGAADPDPRNLSSTFTTDFNSDGATDVVLRFAPFVDGVDDTGVHKQLFAMNGFEVLGPLGETYCFSVANSTGAAAVIWATGSASVSAGDLVLHSAPVPDQPGLFALDVGQALVPFGNGFLCLASNGGIYPPIFPVGGEAALLLGASGLPPGTITPGSTWNFQYLYRDPAGGGARFNSSNGITLVFAP